MKVALPIEGKSIEDSVCQSFGRTPYYLIYDTETKSEKFIDNSAAQSQGGAGISAAQTLVDEAIDAVLTFRCGENAAEVLKAAGVKIYRLTNDSVQQAILGYEKEILLPLAEIHPGFHNHGGR